LRRFKNNLSDVQDSILPIITQIKTNEDSDFSQYQELL